MTTPLLQVEDLKVSFKVKSGLKAFIEKDQSRYIDAVKNVSFSMEKGQSFGLVGESGSGKTTLAHAILGLVKSRQGSVRFMGQELISNTDAAFKAIRRDVSMMFQDPAGSLSPRLKVKYQLTEPFRIHGIKDKDLDKEASKLLDLVNLSASLGDHYPHQLSGGQARRVGVAQALALSPKLVIADEPTAGLDVSVQGEILNLLNQLQEQLGVSFLIITHNLAVVRHFSERMAIMYLGRFLEQGYTDKVFARMRHPYTHALLSAHPVPDPDAVHERVELKGEVPSLLNRPPGCEFHTRCPFVQPKCKEVFPDKSEASTDHIYFCHYPLTH